MESWIDPIEPWSTDSMQGKSGHRMLFQSVIDRGVNKVSIGDLHNSKKGMVVQECPEGLVARSVQMDSV